jgi:hypothetical protein
MTNMGRSYKSKEVFTQISLLRYGMENMFNDPKEEIRLKL